MTAAQRLYTPELLALAVELADYPPLETALLHAEARSPTCGSTLAMDLALDADGRIARFGMRVRACAVGQAAAAIFARHAPGRDHAEIRGALARLEAVAKEKGSAIGIASAKPGTIKQLSQWAGQLQGKNIILIPVSAAIRSQRQS